jgi:nucleoside-diphosphate-sugar epimerase
MRVLVNGATGHIGSYLVPRLVAAGHDVVALSRGRRRPYRQDPAWSTVEVVHADREAEEAAGTFAARVVASGAEAVVDLTCFTLASACSLAAALGPVGTYLLHCGTIWVHGPAVEVPTVETAPRHPIDEYGRQKAAIEAFLLGEAAAGSLRATVLHPGHIVGPGWLPVNPLGNVDPSVFGTLARGEHLAVPNLGLEMLHHVHADDVAQAFELALGHPDAAIGESFHIVSRQAVTVRGYAAAVASWFGQEAVLDYLPFESWRLSVGAEDGETSWRHLARSSCVSIEKAQRLLGYTPRYSSLEAVREALEALVDAGEVDTGGRRPVGPG